MHRYQLSIISMFCTRNLNMLLRQRQKHGSDIRCSGWVSMSSSVYGTRIRDIKMTLKQIMCCMQNWYYHFRFPLVTLPTVGVPSVLPMLTVLQLFPRKVTPSRPTSDNTFTRQTRVLVTKELVFNEKSLVFCVFFFFE